MNSETTKTRVIKSRAHLAEVQVDHKPTEKRIAQLRKTYRSVAEQAAESSFYEKNFLVLDFKNKKPDNKNLIYVSRYFPYAKGGALYIDEPVTEADKKECEIKAEWFKALGLRYLVITHEMSLMDVLERLA